MSDTTQIDETPESDGLAPGAADEGTPGRDSADHAPEESEQRRGGLSRRQFLPAAAGFVATIGVAGVAGYELRGSGGGGSDGGGGSAAANLTGPAPGEPGSGRAAFVTEPNLRPAIVKLNTGSATVETSPRFVALAPMPIVTYSGEQRGPMLLDRLGRLVWYRPGPDSTFDVQVQEYKGKPVITWWHGHLVGGHGAGVGEIVDTSYKPIATVGDADKVPLDLHELSLTPRGTAYATQYEVKTVDLSSIGGATRGKILVGHALEIDVATNHVVFDWVTLDHVGIEESHAPIPAEPGGTFDFFHINSIAETEDGNLLISGRNTWTIYKVNKRTGRIIWRLGGKNSDFKIDEPAEFSWQHHVRPHGNAAISLFDNANTSGHGSLALILNVDEAAKHASLQHVYQHPAKFLSPSLGSVQTQPNGNVFVGWGTQPYFSEFTQDGELVYDSQFDGPFRSYRTFLVDWTAQPSGKPQVVARIHPGGGFAIFASWNGATEIDRWLVLAGSPHSLKEVGSQAWSGFETTVVVNSQGPAFQVVAIDKNGNELGRSDVV